MKKKMVIMGFVGLMIVIALLAVLLTSSGNSNAEGVTIMSATLPSGRSGTSSIWDGSDAYIFGGGDAGNPFNQTLKYNTSTDIITILPTTLPSPRGGTSAIINGSIAYIFGGYENGTYTNEIIRYNTNNNTITTMGANLSTGRAGTSAIWNGTYTYIFGGVNGWVNTNQILRYDPLNDTIIVMSATLPISCHGTSAIWDGQYAYIFGGWHWNAAFDGFPLDTVIRYDPSIDNVTILAEKLPSGRFGTSAVWDGEYGYIFSGRYSDMGPRSDEILKFNPLLINVSIMNSTLPTPRFYTSAIFDGVYSYIFGGDDGTYLNQIVRFHSQDIFAPPAPLNVTAIPDTWTNINSFLVNWTEPFDESGIKTGAQYKISSPPINNSDGTWQGNKPMTVISLEGIQTIYVWLEDNNGNKNFSNYNTTILYLDTTPPDPFTPGANPNGWTNNTQPEITFSTTDGLSGIDQYEVKVDAGGFTSQTSPYILPFQSEGTHTVTVRAYDLAGNYRDETVEIYIDTLPPEAPINVNVDPSGWTNINSFLINWIYPTETDTSGIKNGVWYKLGSPPIHNSDGIWEGSKPTTVVSSEGQFTIYLWLEDNVGNINFLNNGTTLLYLDTTPPDPFTPTANPSSWTINTQPEITYLTIDGLSGIDHYEVKIDSGGFTTQTSPYTLPTQTSGIHNIIVRAFDFAGNYRDGYVDVFIDNILPEPFTPTANPSSWTNSTQPEITFLTTDSLSGIDYYEVQINSGGFLLQTSPHVLSSQNDGIHNITVRVFDLVGNYRDGYVEVFIDTTPPEAPTGIVTIPATWTNNNLFSINWTFPFEVNTSGIKPGAWYKIGSPPVNNSDGTWQGNKPMTVTSIEGAQTIYVWLEDNVGNRNYTNYNTTIIYLDTTPPDAFSPNADPDDWTTDNTPQITFSTTDAESGMSHYEIQVASGGFSTQTSPYTLPSQTDGTHTITVRAYDNAGNYWEGTVDIYIDTTPPEAPTDVIATPDTWTNINSFEIDWTDPTEGDTSGIATGAWYKIGSPPTSNSDGTWLAAKPITVSSLEGEQTIYLWLDDNVGNTNYLNYTTTTVYLDTTPPQAPIDLIPSPDSWTNVNSFSIQWTNPSDLSGIKTGAWYKIGSAPTSNSDGTWVANKPFTVSSIESEQPIYVWLEDNLGNVDYNNHATTNLYLDTTPPAAPSNAMASPGGWTIANSFSIDWINPVDDSGIKSGAWYKIGSPPSSDSDGIWIADKPISITSLEGEHTVYIWLEDNVGNRNYLNNSAVDIFLDSTAPNIVHTAVTKADIGKEITVSATVTDNVVVKNVKLYYRKNGDETFEIIDMVGDGDIYSATIPSSVVTSKGIEYYISASDEINTATHPSSNAITEPLPIEIEDDSEPWITSWWWLFLLLAIVLVVIFMLLALRRPEEGGEVGAIEPEETQVEPTEDLGDTQGEPGLTEGTEDNGLSTTKETDQVPPTPSQEMADDEIFQNIKKMHEEGKISEKTFEDFKRRYLKE